MCRSLGGRYQWYHRHSPSQRTTFDLLKCSTSRKSVHTAIHTPHVFSLPTECTIEGYDNNTCSAGYQITNEGGSPPTVRREGTSGISGGVARQRGNLHAGGEGLGNLWPQRLRLFINRAQSCATIQTYMKYQLAVCYDWTAANRHAEMGYELVSVVFEAGRFCYFFKRVIESI
jgi:hypothetical protein